MSKENGAVAIRDCAVFRAADFGYRLGATVTFTGSSGPGSYGQARRELAPLEPVDDVVTDDALRIVGHRAATLDRARIVVAAGDLVAYRGATERTGNRRGGVAASAAELVADQAAGDAADDRTRRAVAACALAVFGPAFLARSGSQFHGSVPHSPLAHAPSTRWRSGPNGLRRDRHRCERERAEQRATEDSLLHVAISMNRHRHDSLALAMEAPGGRPNME